MSIRNQHIEFDELARMLILENSDSDNAIIKSIEMQAQYLFSTGNTAELIHPAEKEAISRMAKAFNHYSGFWNFQNVILFSSVLIIASYMLFNFLHKAPPLPPTGNMQPIIQPFISDEDTSNHKAKRINENQSELVMELVDEIPTDNQAKLIEKKKEHTINGNHTNYFPPHKNLKKVRTIFPADPPVFDGKVDVKNFVLLTDSFFLASVNSEIEYKIGVSKGILFVSDYYKGEPFKNGFDDMAYFNNGDFLVKEKEERIKKMSKWKETYYLEKYSAARVPNSFRMYCASDDIVLNKRSLFADKINDEAIIQFIQPFYFRKFEVTIGEYFEFLTWVQTTNGYGEVDLYKQLKLDESHAQQEKDIPSYKKYEGLIKAVDFDKVFIYQFFKPELNGVNSIYVFPDDSCFKKDYPYSYIDFIANQYFIYPGYFSYPIVGISYFQALAFLDWKTHFHQQQLDEEGTLLKITYKLPTDIQWEIANLSSGNSYSRMQAQGDDSWKCDLSMIYYSQNVKSNSLRNLLNENSMYPMNHSIDGCFYPSIANPDVIKVSKNYADFSIHHISSNGLCWLDGNVSEWMRESYQQNWLPVYSKYLELLESHGTKEVKLIRSILDFYNSQNAENGRLVRGCNWLDERYSNIYGINVAGVYAKKFVDPSAQHSTLGFRYVIEVSLVE